MINEKKGMGDFLNLEYLEVQASGAKFKHI